MSKRKKRRLIILSSVFVLLIAIIVFAAWGNKALMLNKITIESENLPESFNGLKIAHISDLHNDEFGKDNVKLISLIEKSNPDIIAITGDIIDAYRTDVEVALDFAEKAMQIAPCYYVNGNHEQRISEDYTILKEGLEKIGVEVLENEKTSIEINGENINVLGLSDPSFEADYLFGETEGVVRHYLDELATNSEGFTLLLSHRPELFETYTDYDIDLVLSGHAHGGQFRVPFMGGLYAPNQGVFPKYDAGLYTKNGTNMIVSRGVGNSLFPLRLNNRPEVILIEIVR